MNDHPATSELVRRIEALEDQVKALSALAAEEFGEGALVANARPMSNAERNRLLDEAPKGMRPVADGADTDTFPPRRDVLSAPHREQ